MSRRLAEMWLARSAASIVWLDRLETSPSPPALANASATVIAQAASSAFSRSHSRSPWIGPLASSFAQLQETTKSSHCRSSRPVEPASCSSPPLLLVAKLRRSAGRADDVPPPPPPAARGGSLPAASRRLGHRCPRARVGQGHGRRILLAGDVLLDPLLETIAVGLSLCPLACRGAALVLSRAACSTFSISVATCRSAATTSFRSLSWVRPFCRKRSEK